MQESFIDLLGFFQTGFCPETLNMFDTQTLLADNAYDHAVKNFTCCFLNKVASKGTRTGWAVICFQLVGNPSCSTSFEVGGGWLYNFLLYV